MKNNYSIDKFISDIESVKMTQTEKEQLRDNLSSFAVNYKPRVSPYHHFMLMAKRSFTFAFLVVFSLSSISYFGSKDSLPGDTLYPVKIAHEELTAATKTNSQKKVNYEIRRTEKRIQEATVLAQQEKLDEVAQKEIAKNIKIQSQKVQVSIEEIKENDPEEAFILNSELKSTIKINSDALRKVTTAATEAMEMSDEESPFVEDDLAENKIQQDTEILLQKNETQEQVVQLSIETEKEEIVEPEKSSAETLLDSIDEDIKEIEAFAQEVSDEIIHKEEKKTLEFPNEQAEKPQEEAVEMNTAALEESSDEIIYTEIETLQDIIDIRKKILKLKGAEGEIHTHTEETVSEDGLVVSEIIFNEPLLREQAALFIKDQNYGKGFIVLQKILEHIQEEKITLAVEKDLGIELEEQQVKPVEPEVMENLEIPTL